MNVNLTSTKSPNRGEAKFDRGKFWLDESPVIPPQQLANPDLGLQSRKMAVVNLEAALASWKSLENHKVSQLSQTYRFKYSASLRITPTSTGGLPQGLMNHCFSRNMLD